jgi:hypothetical protein
MAFIEIDLVGDEDEIHTASTDEHPPEEVELWMTSTICIWTSNFTCKVFLTCKEESKMSIEGRRRLLEILATMEIPEMRLTERLEVDDAKHWRQQPRTPRTQRGSQTFERSRRS